MRCEKGSMNETNISRDTNDNGSRYSPGFLFILPIVFVIILIGNVLLLCAIKLIRVLRVPDLLVGSLAGKDLLARMRTCVNVHNRVSSRSKWL